jgi:hypothetical protein
MRFKHRHKWMAIIPFTIKKGNKEFARICCYCRCGKIIHKHLPSLDELKKEEQNGN